MMNNADLENLKNEIFEFVNHDGTKMFTVLLLLSFINNETGKIPDYLRSPEINDIIDFIENSETLKRMMLYKNGTE